MSQVPASLHPKEDDILKLLACQSHIGTKNLDPFNEPYVYKRRNDGIYLINLAKTWEKLMLAARVIVAIENPQDVVVISARPLSARAVLKYARYTGGQAIAGRFTPGTFTNQIQKAFKEPRLLIVTDPRTDHQAITEAAYVNIPVIAFSHTDTPLKNVDIAIPCNNKGKHAIGLMYWLLAREVLRMRNNIARTQPWDVMVDMFFYRDADEQEKQEEAAAAAAAESFQRNMFEGAAPIAPADGTGAPVDPTAPVDAAAAAAAGAVPAIATGADWAAGPEGSWDAAAATSDWAGSAQGGEWAAEGTAVAAAPAAAAPAPAAAAAAPVTNEWDAGALTTDWAQTPQ